MEWKVTLQKNFLLRKIRQVKPNKSWANIIPFIIITQRLQQLLDEDCITFQMLYLNETYMVFNDKWENRGNYWWYYKQTKFWSNFNWKKII